MPRYEYKLVPAPEKATKHKGLKGVASFAATLEQMMNALGAEGWHYLRTDTLPQEERAGLTSRTTTYRNLLVFQRALPEDPPAPPPPRFSKPAVDIDPPDAPDEDTEKPSLANLFAEDDDIDTPPPRAPRKP